MFAHVSKDSYAVLHKQQKLSSSIKHRIYLGRLPTTLQDATGLFILFDAPLERI